MVILQKIDINKLFVIPPPCRAAAALINIELLPWMCYHKKFQYVDQIYGNDLSNRTYNTKDVLGGKGMES